MSVFDKELIINGEAVRSPEQQVYKNMEDIKTLFQKIQTWYNCSEELEETDNTVLRTYTNVPDSASSGLLIDPVGNMFSITGGDDTTLLITFYASIKGPQGDPGESGAELEIDDSGTSATKVWSSQKVASELANAGKTYYQHNIKVQPAVANGGQVQLIITNDDDTPYNFTSLVSYVKSGNNTERHVWGRADGNNSHLAYALGYFTVNNTDYLRIYYLNTDGTGGSTNPQDSSYWQIDDDVVEI